MAGNYLNQGILFALFAAVIFGVYSVLQKQASKSVNPLLVAIIISFTAMLLGILLILPSINTNLFTDYRGIIFAILAGCCALGLAFFAVSAYSSGLQISIVGPIIFGGGVAAAAILGILLGEPISTLKIVGILLAIAGAGILAAGV